MYLISIVDVEEAENFWAARNSDITELDRIFRQDAFRPGLKV